MKREQRNEQRAVQGNKEPEQRASSRRNEPEQEAGSCDRGREVRDEAEATAGPGCKKQEQVAGTGSKIPRKGAGF